MSEEPQAIVTSYRAIQRAVESIRSALREIEDCRRPEKILEWLCQVMDGERKIYEECAYIQGYQDGRAEAGE